MEEEGLEERRRWSRIARMVGEEAVPGDVRLSGLGDFVLSRDDEGETRDEVDCTLHLRPPR